LGEEAASSATTASDHIAHLDGLGVSALRLAITPARSRTSVRMTDQRWKSMVCGLA
jgi:hypothetical protein